MDSSIGVKIKMLRKEQGDTLKSLAKKINYDWSNLSKVERGVYGATVGLITRICEVYNVNPNYLLGNFTESEGKLLAEKNHDLSELKQKYDFKHSDGSEVTDEEILEALRLIRYLKQ